MEKIMAFGPASVANVGPFYDVMGYCLDHIGDIVVAEKTSAHREALLKKVSGHFCYDIENEKIPNEENTVQIVGQIIWENFRSQYDFGIDLTLYKNMPTQSGLGSSAASSVATAKAILNLIEFPDLTEENETTILNWMIEGEKAAAEQHYPDNIVPSFYGGFRLINRHWQQELESPNFWTIIFLKNKAQTKKMRNVINEHFKNLIKMKVSPDFKIEKILNYIRTQSSQAALLVDSLRSGSIPNFARCFSISENNFLEESRGPLITDFMTHKKYILDHGALGCAISGSGPAIACIVDSYESAVALKEQYLSSFGKDHYWLISDLNTQGAKIITDIDEWTRDNSYFHNFWE